MWGHLTGRERTLRQTLLEGIVRRGRTPSKRDLAHQLGMSEPDVERLLRGLETKGFLVRDLRSRAVVAAYPLSVRPSPHRVTLKTGEQAFALCAIDALGVAPLFGVRMTAEAACPQCGKAIRIVLRPGAIVSYEPSTMVVWYSLPDLLTKRVVGLNLAEAH